MQRREHRKSRNGCTPCKRRRVKCDERTPCANCIRRKEDCDNFLPQAVRKCKNCIRQQEAPTSTRVLYLMHHYSLYTANSLMEDDEMQRLWKNVIPEEALRHPFLMEGLLAMSALHLTSERPNERSIWTPLALKHQEKALASFRSTLPSLNEENCHALFALSTLISVTSMAFSSFGTILSPGESLPISDIIEPFTLIRGVGDLLGVASEWLSVGPLSSILGGHVVNICQYPVPPPVADRFGDLRRMVEVMCPDQNVRKTLSEALDSLEYVFTEVICSRGTKLGKDVGIAWKWPHMTSQGYMALLRDSNDGALVIFAHFALLSDSWKDKWYLHDWAERVVDSITSKVNSGWSEWIRWPQEQIREGFPIFACGVQGDTQVEGMEGRPSDQITKAMVYPHKLFSLEVDQWGSRPEVHRKLSDAQQEAQNEITPVYSLV